MLQEVFNSFLAVWVFYIIFVVQQNYTSIVLSMYYTIENFCEEILFYITYTLRLFRNLLSFFIHAIWMSRV